jgi:protein ImuB
MFACIYILDFPVQASLLPEPREARFALTRSPIAVLDGPANLPRVFATNPAARRAGIQTGMTKLQAEVCTGAVLRKRSLAEEDSAQSALLDCAAAFSPRVESTAPGATILDLTGTEKLFACADFLTPAAKRRQSTAHGANRGSNAKSARAPEGRKKSALDPQAPWHLALHALTSKAAAVGFAVRAALASNPDAAFLAARGFPENKIIPIGEEPRHLATLSIETLPLSPELHELLHSWGIRTFASLAALPEVAIVERLGQQGRYLQKLARGAISRPLLIIEPNSDFIADFEFDDPVETLESIFFILNRLLHDLCFRLISVAQAASELRLTLNLNIRHLQNPPREAPPNRRDGVCLVSPQSNNHRASPQQDEFTHVWKLPAPTQDKNLLFNLIRLLLEKTTFSAPISRIKIEVIPVKPRLSQGGLFAPPSPEPEKLEFTLERIRGVVGSIDSDGIACVGSPHIPDTHKPGSFLVQHFLVETGPAPSPAPLQPAISALRVFRPALPTSVELTGETPHFVRLWSRHRRVLAASGPWSTSGNWWNATTWMREEWDVALKMPAGPGLYRIYRNRLQDQWFVEGMFD